MSFVILLGASSCRQEAREPLGVGEDDPIRRSLRETLKREKPNVLFIILDAARAREFGSWGYARETTPHIDALGDEAFVFLNAFSQAPATRPSVLSYFSGRYFPVRFSKDENIGFGEGEHTLAMAFKQAGYRTGGFSENPFITNDFGFDVGFEHFEEFTEFWLLREKEQTHLTRDREKIVDRAIEWIVQAEEESWFAYVHLLRPHAPYIAPEPYGKRFVGAYTGPLDGTVTSLRSVREIALPEEAEHLKDLYDGNLAYADELVRRMVESLREEGLFDNTWIVVASDHGEAFMEHGRLEHGGYLYDEAIHVPLVIKPASNSAFSTRRVDALVEMVDLYPTFVEAFGLAPPSRLDGRSLLGLMLGNVTEHKPYVYAFAPDPRAISIRSTTEKFLFRYGERFGPEGIGNMKLFNLSNDPSEQIELANTGRNLRVWRKLAKKHVALRDSQLNLRQVELSEERREQLEAVGYLQ